MLFFVGSKIKKEEEMPQHLLSMPPGCVVKQEQENFCVVKTEQDFHIQTKKSLKRYCFKNY